MKFATNLTLKECYKFFLKYWVTKIRMETIWTSKWSYLSLKDGFYSKLPKSGLYNHIFGNLYLSNQNVWSIEQRIWISHLTKHLNSNYVANYVGFDKFWASSKIKICLLILNLDKKWPIIVLNYCIPMKIFMFET